MAGLYPNSGVPASQALNTVDVPTTNCTTELFYSTSRCQPRFDPAAANALISEVLNVVAGSGLTYDCSSLTNLSRALNTSTAEAINEALTGCLTATFEDLPNMEAGSFLMLAEDPAGCVQIREATNARVQLNRLFNEFLQECITASIPDAGETCGTLRQLVLIDDGAGCNRIAFYNGAAVVAGASGAWGDIAGHQPPNSSGFLLPDDFANPTNYYSPGTLLADDNNGAGVINEGRVLNSRLVSMNFTLDCATTMQFNSGFFAEAPADVQTAFVSRASLFYRYRVNGGAWIYPRTGGGQLAAFAQFNGVEQRKDVTFRLGVPAGNIDMEVFYAAQQPTNMVNPPVKIIANTFPVSGGVGNGSPSFFGRQSL